MNVKDRKQELRNLVAKYQQGTATAEEKVFIDNYYRYFDNETAPSLKLSEEEKKLLENKILSEINESINKAETVAKPVHRVHFLRTAWFRYAAAILLLITGISVYYFFNTSKSKIQTAQVKPTSVSDDVLPGSDKAVLTLSNGQQVLLNNAASETIQDGSLSIKNDEGQLSYIDHRSRGEGGNADIVAINTMTTPNGGQYKLTLADGTKVWLNAASSIIYPTTFNGKTREVKVSGEVYFEVARNPSKPFKVHVTPSPAGGGERVDP